LRLQYLGDEGLVATLLQQGPEGRLTQESGHRDQFGPNQRAGLVAELPSLSNQCNGLVHLDRATFRVRAVSQRTLDLVAVHVGLEESILAGGDVLLEPT